MRRHPLVAVGLPLQLLPRGGVVQGGPRRQRGLDLAHCRVDVLALARARAMSQRREDREHGSLPGERVRKRLEDLRGRTAHVAGGLGEAAEGVDVGR